MKTYVQQITMLCLFLLFSKVDAVASIFRLMPPDTATTQLSLMDVRYGPHERNVMDIYLPAERDTNTAFVVNIHGGAWTQGDKEFDTALAEYLQQQGIAFANINYRYANMEDTHLPQLLDDIDSIVHYLTSHGKAWNTRQNGFAICGSSSGAHVAMMYAYTRNPNIKTIVENCGPVDLTSSAVLEFVKGADMMHLLDMMSGNTIPWESGAPIPQAYIETSPIQHIRPIPILIVHGDQDEVVPVQQAYALDKALKDRDIVHKTLIVPEAGHHITKEGKERKMVFHEIAQWLLEYAID